MRPLPGHQTQGSHHRAKHMGQRRGLTEAWNRADGARGQQSVREGRGCPAQSMGKKPGKEAVKEPLATSCPVQPQWDDILYCTDARHGAMPGVQRQKKAASGCSPVKRSGQSSRRGFQYTQMQLSWQGENAVNCRPAAWQACCGCLAKPGCFPVGAQSGRVWQAEMRPSLTRAAKAKEGSEARTGSGGPHGQACLTLLLKRTGVLWPKRKSGLCLTNRQRAQKKSGVLAPGLGVPIPVTAAPDSTFFFCPSRERATGWRAG